MTKGLFFDFDGLILDTETPERDAWRVIYGEYDHLFPDEIWMRMIGISSAENSLLPVRDLAERTGLVLDPDEIRQRNREIRLARIDQLGPQPGVVELLDACQAAGLYVSIVSSSSRTWIERHLGRLGLLDRFADVTCGYEGLPSKPAPDLYLRGLEVSGLAADEVWVLEDSPNGIRAAKDAGLRVVAVPNELTGQLDLSAADLRLASLEELLRPTFLAALSSKH